MIAVIETSPPKGTAGRSVMLFVYLHFEFDTLLPALQTASYKRRSQQLHSLFIHSFVRLNSLWEWSNPQMDIEIFEWSKVTLYQSMDVELERRSRIDSRGISDNEFTNGSGWLSIQLRALSPPLIASVPFVFPSIPLPWMSSLFFFG